MRRSNNPTHARAADQVGHGTDSSLRLSVPFVRSACFLFAVVALSCDTASTVETPPAEPCPDPVVGIASLGLRIENLSSIPLDSTQVEWKLGFRAERPVGFSRLEPLARSCYQVIPSYIRDPKDGLNRPYEWLFAKTWFHRRGWSRSNAYSGEDVTPDLAGGLYTYRVRVEGVSTAMAIPARLELDFAGGDSVRIRVRNEAPMAFESVVVAFEGEQVDFGPLGVADISAYFPVNRAYRYGWTRLIAGADTMLWEPDDWTGERPVDPGYYSIPIDTVHHWVISQRGELIRDRG